MKKSILVLISLLIINLPIIQVDANTSKSEDYLVGFTEEIDLEIIKQNGGKIEKVFEELLLVETKLSENSARKLSSNTNIDFIEKNVKFHQTSKYSLSQNLNEYPWGVKYINADLVHKKNNITGKGVSVAVLDTGIDINHEDLNIIESVSFVSPYRGLTNISRKTYAKKFLAFCWQYPYL